MSPGALPPWLEIDSHPLSLRGCPKDGQLDFWCRSGEGVFCQLHDVFPSIEPVLDFFGGDCSTPQHPPPPHQKSNGPFLRCYQALPLFMWWKNWIYMYYSRCFFLYITKRISSDNFDRKRVRMLVPFRGQNQWSGTFDDVSNFSGLPETYLVPFRVFFAQ